MKSFGSLLFGLCVAAPAFGLPTTMPSTQPQDAPAASQPVAVDPSLGKLFRSRLHGIELYPPAGGTIIRQLNSGEIVRFAYTDRSWDVRVKPIPLHVPMKLSAPAPQSGILELTASQFVDTNPTSEILRQEVVTVHGSPVGMIEARYNAGTDRVFAQQAIFRDNDRHYFVVQMNSPGKPKNSQDKETDPQEVEARTVFAAMCNTVRILDRAELRQEQDHRLLNTRQFWAQLDGDKLLKSLQPLHFMRLVRDGKDVGFVQMNERPATHSGKSGLEIIVHSQMQIPVETAISSAKADAAADPTGIVVPTALTPSKAGTAQPLKPEDLYSSSIYFVTLDRAHEDWISSTQTGARVATQTTEMANSDLADHLALNPAELAENQRAHTKGGEQPPVVQVPDYLLDVSQYSQGRTVGKPFDTKLMWFYLPQAIGQILPRVLPKDPVQYMFGFYIGRQREVMSRYVDVDMPRQVTLDGQSVWATPISDRIGVDGNPTIHYVSRSGEWLGSVSEESQLEVLPADEKTLKSLWPDFAVSPEPPLRDDQPAPVKRQLKSATPIDRDPAEVQPMVGNSR